MNKINILIFVLATLTVLTVSCSKDELVDKEEVVEIEDPVDNNNGNVLGFDYSNEDPNKIVSINTGSGEGLFYNFWSTRPMVNQTRFNSSGFRNSIQNIKPYVKSYNLVRTMGGRTDNLNTFYKGVDASGKIITDFSGLIQSMRNFMSTGFKPRIVLDNVPWQMSLPKVDDTYGNSKPPNDYGLWRQYVNAYLQALVDEFGMSEVKSWRFRIATEPNYTPHHWRGAKEEFFKHYDITVDEVLKVIPDAIVGPGNLLTERLATFTTEIIDHCATGTNYATGEIGTKMDFFSLSYYEKLNKKEVRFENVVKHYRNKLNSYTQFSNIPFDIQEFGILRGDNGVRGLSLSDATEVGASWYATITDLAFKYNITEIYDWGQELESSTLPTGRRNVTEMFLKLEGGIRLFANENLSGFSGVIPVAKNGNLYLLVYNYNTTRSSTNSKTVFPIIEGSQISNNTTWKMNEWTIDKENSILMNELYKDIRANGVGEKSNGRIYGNRPSDRFEDGWKSVLDNNNAKYTQLSKLSLTINDSIVGKFDEKLMLKVDLAPHAVKLIELIPQ
ncbi:GH39 family glycosyl hydrolase [Polaribacter aestuariivivens]|uniref:GH39 family glycosyl hydrolase n=1 Tax=Polaribacter aestuariivivens TaxID=2304626 RepID=UPI003F49B413